MGDICNLLGSKLTHQKPFQVYLAAYFVLIDSCLLTQCIYYKSIVEQVPLSASTLSPSLLSPLLLSSPVNGFNGQDTIGPIISWLCCLLYLSSRIPQILFNHNTKSVKSLSMGMFACALGGNISYSLSLSLNWDSSSIPFLIGSVGTIWLDIIVFLQYYKYKEEGHHD